MAYRLVSRAGEGAQSLARGASYQTPRTEVYVSKTQDDSTRGASAWG